MTRDEFLDGFAERLRNVLQKHGREQAANIEREFGRVGRNEVRHAENNLDAAIDELGRFAWDATHAEALT